MTFNIIDRLEIYDKSPLCRHWGGVSSWNNFMQTFETKFPYSCIFFFFYRKKLAPKLSTSIVDKFLNSSSKGEQNVRTTTTQDLDYKMIFSCVRNLNDKKKKKKMNSHTILEIETLSDNRNERK